MGVEKTREQLLEELQKLEEEVARLKAAEAKTDNNTRLLKKPQTN